MVTAKKYLDIAETWYLRIEAKLQQSKMLQLINKTVS